MKCLCRLLFSAAATSLALDTTAQSATEPTTKPAEARTAAADAAPSPRLNPPRPRDPNNPLRYATESAPLPDDQVSQQASCLIQIEGGTELYDDGTGRNIYPVAALANTTNLLDPAAKEVLGFTPEQRRDLVRVAAAPLQPRFVSIEVVLKKSSQAYPPDAAQQFLSKLCESIKSALEESIKVRAQSAANRREKLEKDLAKFKDRQEVVREKIRLVRSKTGSSYAYGDRQTSIQNLKQQIQSSEPELARLRARLRAADPDTSPLVAEWAKMVDIREARVAELKQAKADGTATQAQLDEAIKSLEDARVQLATAKQAIQSEPNRRNNVDVESLKSQIAEIEARLAPMRETLKNLEDPEIGKLMDDLPELQAEEQQLRSNIQGTQQRLAEFDRNFRDDASVIITVIDGKPDVK